MQAMHMVELQATGRHLPNAPALASLPGINGVAGTAYNCIHTWVSYPLDQRDVFHVRSSLDLAQKLSEEHPELAPVCITVSAHCRSLLPPAIATACTMSWLALQV
jgi:hypothetical protein